MFIKNRQLDRLHMNLLPQQGPFKKKTQTVYHATRENAYAYASRGDFRIKLPTSGNPQQEGSWGKGDPYTWRILRTIYTLRIRG